MVRALPDEAWDEPSAMRLGRRSDAHHQDLHLLMLAVAARYDLTARARLVETAENGSLDALAAMGDLRSLPSEVAAVLITAASDCITQIRSDALQVHSRCMGTTTVALWLC